MIVPLMRAARDYVAAKMAADETISELVFAVRATIEETPPPEDRHTIEVKVREVKGDLATLKDWIIETSVGSPVDVEGVTVDNHAALELAVMRAWDKSLHSTAESDLAAKVTTHIPGWTLGGFHAVGWDEAREDNSLLPVYEVKAGVMRV